MVRQGAVAGQRYRFSDHGGSNRGMLHGMYVLRDGCGCRVYRPTWNHTRTVFRMLPGRNPDNPEEVEPFRLSDTPGDFGDWIRRYEAVVSLGTPGVTFITHDQTDLSMDRQQLPPWVLYRAISSAVNTGNCHPSWNPLVRGGQGRGAQISAPTDVYLVQAVLLEHRSQVQQPPMGLQADHPTVVMVLSASAGEALLNQVNAVNENNQPLYPDMVDIDGGVFVDLHQAGTMTAGPQAAGQAGPITLGTGAVQQSGGQSSPMNRYECDILETYNGFSPRLTDYRAVILSKIKPWDEIVRIPTVEEQMSFICSAGLPASAVVHALQDLYGEHIPAHVYEQYRASLQQPAQQQIPAQAAGSGPAPGAQQPQPGFGPATGAQQPQQQSAPEQPQPQQQSAPEQPPQPAAAAEQAASLQAAVQPPPPQQPQAEQPATEQAQPADNGGATTDRARQTAAALAAARARVQR